MEIEQTGGSLMDDLIARLREAIQSYDPREMVTFEREGFSYDRPRLGLLEWMPIMRTGDKITIKIVGYHPENPGALNLPTIISTVSMYDAANGHLLGLVDGTFLTALRTGAASAVASQVLSSPEARVLGLIGGGANSLSQLHALSRVMEVESVLVYDQDPAVSASFPERASFLSLNGARISAPGLEEVVRAADVICTSTSVGVGQGPVFEDHGLKPWIHINAVGSDFRGKTELPLSLLKRSCVCPDFPSQALVEGECQQLTPDEVGPSLVDLVKDPAKFEHLQKKPSVFDSTGWALEDHVALEMLLAHAARLGLGTRTQIENITADPRNPYHFVGK